MRTREVAVEELDEIEDRRVPGLIGPLPLHAAIELLFRVREMRIDGSMTVDSEDFYVDVVVDHAPSVNEIEIFHRVRAEKTTPILSIEDSLQDILIQWVNAENAVEQRSPSIFDPDETWRNEIFADDEGKYWLSGFIDVHQQDFFGLFFRTYDTEFQPQGMEFSIDLVLSDGTYPIRGLATSEFFGGDVTDANLTITATAWYPYQTLAGLPAWDEETGLPINGGPAA